MDELQNQLSKRSSLYARIRSSNLFRGDLPVTGAKEVIGWWESCRIPYNLIVGSAGIVACISCGVVLVQASVLDPNGLDVGLPLVGPIIILLYGIAANICYTAGWIAEWIIGKLWPHEANRFATTSFFVGLVLPVLLTLAQAIVCRGRRSIRLDTSYLRCRSWPIVSGMRPFAFFPSSCRF